MRIEKPDSIVAIHANRPLEVAVETATIKLMDWLVADYGFSPTDAYCLVSTCPDFRINVYQMCKIGKAELRGRGGDSEAVSAVKGDRSITGKSPAVPYVMRRTMAHGWHGSTTDEIRDRRCNVFFEKHVEHDFIVLETRRKRARWKRTPRFSTGCYPWYCHAIRGDSRLMSGHLSAAVLDRLCNLAMNRPQLIAVACDRISMGLPVWKRSRSQWCWSECWRPYSWKVRGMWTMRPPCRVPWRSLSIPS